MKQSIVILEGPDGAGKTTLANSYKEFLSSVGIKSKIIHKSQPKSTNFRSEFMRPLMIENLEFSMAHEEDKNYVLIVDRWHLGEFPYGKLFRGKSIMTKDDFYEVEEFLDETFSVKRFIVCPPEKETKERAFTRGEDFVKEEQFSEIWNFFNAFANFDSNWKKIDSLTHKVSELNKSNNSNKGEK